MEEQFNMEFRIDTFGEGHDIRQLAGLFFEDINYAGDGGLYAELLPNRSFEFSKEDGKDFHPLSAWQAVKSAKLKVLTGDGPFRNNPHYLQVMGDEEEQWGVENTGYNQGIPLKHRQFNLSVFARGDFSNQILIASLVNDRDETVASREFVIQNSWKKIDFNLSSSQGEGYGKLRITTKQGKDFQLAFVSLFPVNTFKGRKNGLRKDIAEALAAMEPKFLRFPGGCLVHAGSLNKEDRNSIYRWKNTVEPIEERAYKVAPWQYPQSYGLGFFEFFQFCEDIGCEAIPVISGGCNPHDNTAWPLDDFQEWIDEALDLIEFATGPADSYWGQKRALLGHPEPFSLKYLAIGNEESQPAFFERYHLIHREVKKRYPEIALINTAGCFCGGGDYEQGWQSARCEGSEFIDEHYYQAPDWFIANHNHYQKYDSKGPKVFLGEYASMDNGLFHALAEASYLIGLQQAPAVAMACYAPMLCNVDHVNWRPDMIFYDSYRLALSSSYYVQKMFMNHLGKQNVPLKLHCEDSEWEYRYTYRQQTCGEARISVTNGNPDTKIWNLQVQNLDNNEIKIFDDRELSADDLSLSLGNIGWENYRISFSFSQKILNPDQDKLIVVDFALKDEKNYCSWVLGQWLNAQNQITEHTDGYMSTLQQYTFSIEDQRPYQLSMTVRKNHITTVIDGVNYHSIERQPVVIPPLYGALSVDEDKLYLKLVNLQAIPHTFKIDLSSYSSTGFDMERVILTGDLQTENTIDRPHLLKETLLPKKTVAGCFEETVPAHCFMAITLRIDREGIR